MKRLLVLPLLVVALACAAAGGPYNEAAHAKAEIRQALTHAAQSGKSVIVVFGANWCGDCKVLDIAMKEGASAGLVARDFTVVKVDVGRFDRNVAVAESYGVPLKNGIPAVVILSPSNEVLYATRAGELADAEKMGDTGIYDFLKKVVPPGKT